jgi:hypothetical protein
MQEFIARENIRLFRRQLENCTDEQQRATLKQLLAQEEERLTQIAANGVPSTEPPKRGPVTS